MGINDILNIARSGISVNQSALKVTGHNVANVNTPGYSRQRISLKSIGGAGMLGAGVSLADVRRVHDQFLEKQVNRQKATLEFLNGRDLLTQQLDAVFPDADADGVSNALSTFFNALREVANNPSALPERQQAVHAAERLAGRVSEAYTNLESMQHNLNGDVSSMVGQANAYLQEIAALNKKIAAFNDPAGGQEASDLLDKRDEAVRSLNDLLDVTTFVDGAGNVNVMMANHMLVEGAQAGKVSTTPGALFGVQIETAAGNAIDVTDRLAQADGKGKIAGMLYERDGFIEDLKGKLDAFAYTLATRVNAIHQTNYGLDGGSGRDFFAPIAQVNGAAKLFAVDQGVADNPEWIAAASDAASVNGDNRGIAAIIDLQDDATAMGSTSFSEFLIDVIGAVSNRANALERELSFQDAAWRQADAYRTSIAGVSLDEEMVSLVQYQRAFEASAKMVSTVDQMLTTLIEIKQ
ncbi:MAG: flagellar hook-associated protein FlgK [Myxococcales bacterium]|nr:MAG: flagellar hook-associated protein FlgK [Myxococcales bacterium]